MCIACLLASPKHSAASEAAKRAARFERRPRVQDFLNLLPVPELTRADGGALNLATMVKASLNPSDLGPKCYFGLGRPGEHHAGDSQTRLHLDMTDAVNVMLHQPQNQFEKNGGGTTGPRTAGAWQPPLYQVCDQTSQPLLGMQPWRVIEYEGNSRNESTAVPASSNSSRPARPNYLSLF